MVWDRFGEEFGGGGMWDFWLMLGSWSFDVVFGFLIVCLSLNIYEKEICVRYSLMYILIVFVYKFILN